MSLDRGAHGIAHPREQPHGRICHLLTVLQRTGRVISDGETPPLPVRQRSEEHTSELQSLMRISYAVFCSKKKTQIPNAYQARALNTTHKNNSGSDQHIRLHLT